MNRSDLLIGFKFLAAAVVVDVDGFVLLAGAGI